MRGRSVNIWGGAAVVTTLATITVIASLPTAAAVGAAAVAGLAALGAAAWFWGEDSRETKDRDPFRPGEDRTIDPRS